MGYARHLRFTALLAAMLLVPRPGGAQNPALVRSEIESVVRAYVDAHNRADAGAIAAFYAREPGVTAVGDGEVYRGWDRIREHLDAMDQITAAGGRLRLTTASIDVFPISDAHALVLLSYTVAVEMPQAGTLQERGVMTLLFRQVGAAWKIIHDHTSTRREDVAQTQAELEGLTTPSAEPATIPIAGGRASEIRPASYIRYTFQLPRGGCRVTGRIEGISGGNKDFRALLLDDDNFRNWNAGLESRVWWQSGQAVVANVDAELTGPGTFHLVIDNTFSTSTAKTVQAWATAQCQ